MSNKLEVLLQTRYETAFRTETSPDWAVRNKKDNHVIRPSVPFIGRRYAASRNKIAVFASAENLTYYEECIEERHFFENWKAEPVSFFPKVHIAPVENGGLICAALFLFKLLGTEWMGEPQDFLEEIAVGNVVSIQLLQVRTSEEEILTMRKTITN
jgi:hypothetical protein